MPVSCTLVQQGLIEITPEDGVKDSRPTCSLLECSGFRVLVDLEHPKEDGTALLAALRAQGVEPPAVDAVFFTHLHPDHIGHKDRFGGALFVFHRDERLAFYFKGDRTMRLTGSALLELSPHGLARPEYVEATPDMRALGRGVYLRHCPGHTPGSLVIFACVDGLVHALAGDTILNQDYFERGRLPGSSWRPELIPEHMEFVRRLADVIVPGHGAPFRNPRG